jgi:hypothetical protein
MSSAMVLPTFEVALNFGLGRGTAGVKAGEQRGFTFWSASTLVVNEITGRVAQAAVGAGRF